MGVDNQIQNESNSGNNSLNGEKEDFSKTPTQDDTDKWSKMSLNEYHGYFLRCFNAWHDLKEGMNTNGILERLVCFLKAGQSNPTLSSDPDNKERDKALWEVVKLLKKTLRLTKKKNEEAAKAAQDLLGEIEPFRRRRRKKMLLILIPSLCVAGTGIGLGAYFSFKEHVVETTIPEHLTLAYKKNQAIDSSGWGIRLQNAWETKTVSGDKLIAISGFDSEKIGDQSVVARISGRMIDSKNIPFVVTVEPQELSAPRNLVNEKSVLSWLPADNAESYTLEISQSVGARPFLTKSGLTACQFDLNNLNYHGSFYVSVIAVNSEKDAYGSFKYKSSPNSDSLALSSVQSVGDISFDGKGFSWPKVDAIEDYTISINGIPHLVTGATRFDYSTSNPGDYSISVTPVMPDQSHFCSSYSEIFHKLKAPILSYESGTISCTIDDPGSLSRVQYYLDGALFSGNVGDVLSAGSHVVTAKWIGQSDQNQIDSEFSSALTLNKLGAPQLMLNSGVLTCSDGTSISDLDLYVDGITHWDGKMDSITSVGKHTITAIRPKTGAFDIASEISNSITVERLPIPQIAFDGTSFTVGNNREGFTVYVDDVKTGYDSLGDEFIASLSAGSHAIRTKNAGNGNDLLPSGNSSQVDVFIPNLDITVGASTLSSESVNVKILDTLNVAKDLTATVTIDFFKSGTNIYTYHNANWSVIPSSGTASSAPYVISLKRNGVVADQIVVKAVLNDFGKGKCLAKTFSKTYSV